MPLYPWPQRREASFADTSMPDGSRASMLICANRKKWKLWDSSLAVAPTTSTTCFKSFLVIWIRFAVAFLRNLDAYSEPCCKRLMGQSAPRH